MDRTPITLIMLAMILWAPGCVTHEVADNYGQYLTNQDGTVQLPETRLAAVYSLTPETLDHRPEFKSATTGLENYRFENSRAKIDLAVTVSGGGGELFRNVYRAEGASQGGKMFWGGAFAMRNAIHQSTKLAMDEILTEFLNDLWAQTQSQTAAP